MNLEHPNFGQSYRLSRLAVRLRTFTVFELNDLSGIVEDTIYSFLSKLTRSSQAYLQWEELPRSTRGRPVKRYTLTEAGVNFLLEKNARIAAILSAEGTVAPSIMAAAQPALPPANRGRATTATAAPATPPPTKAVAKYVASASEYEAIG
jgi:hypothetical protein